MRHQNLLREISEIDGTWRQRFRSACFRYLPIVFSGKKTKSWAKFVAKYGHTVDRNIASLLYRSSKVFCLYDSVPSLRLLWELIYGIPVATH